MTWMIYGANGYTGELIAREAVRRGHRPVLGGRNAEKIEALARELELDARVFALAEAARTSEWLTGVDAVLHCAGPFLETSGPMVAGCIEAQVHYLDITGELGVFEWIFSMSDEAAEHGVTLLPGVGFDVVPTDCLAAKLSERLPSADHLTLAFYARGGEVSRGTMKTMIEGLGDGGAIRRDGKIVRVPMVYGIREIPFSIGLRTAMTIPWGDVSTAFHTTGIPNIEVYTASSPKAIARARWMARLAPVLARGPVKHLLRRVAERRTGPDQTKRSTGRMYLWGEVADAAGNRVSMTMSTPEGYTFTALSAVTAVERLLAADPRPGSFTPARFFGSRFVESIPGVVVD